jgi:tetrahydromethanopterin S-methyltransferase subunit B
MRYSKVEGNKSLVRDEQTKAILNTNKTEYDNYINVRNIKKSEVERMQQLESDVSNMRNDLDEIKDLLRSLANKP